MSTPSAAPLAPAKSVALLFVIVLLISNGVGFFLAFQDKSWEALRIAVLFGPISNVVLAIAGAVLAVVLKRKGLRLSLLLVLGAPCIAAIALFGSIMFLDLHGC